MTKVTITTVSGGKLEYTITEEERFIKARFDGGIETFDYNMRLIRIIAPESCDNSN